VLLEVIISALAGGMVVGLALGLTGGGGTLLAVPVFIHVLGLSARQSAIASLAAVGAMALLGAVTRIRRGEAYLGLGLFFALGGIVGAPLGVMSHRWLPDPLIATGFAVLMVIVAVRMWPDHVRPLGRGTASLPPELHLGRCSLSSDGRLRLNSRCVPVLLGLGLATGILSGIFGVGGGFVIVPALIWLSRCDLRHAVATSLVAVAVISAAGVGGAIISGEPFPVALTLWFTVGGLGGLLLSGHVGHRLSPAVLGRGFSLVLIALAVFVLIRR
jgi:uncharacterized protein